MTARSDWKRVSRRRPCPVCQHTDWCLYTGPDDAPTAAICPRVESDRRAGDGGWLHRLRDDGGPVWSPRMRVIRLAEAGHVEHAEDWDRMAERCRRNLSAAALATLAGDLGLSETSLGRLAVGWSPQHRAYTFPMRRADGACCGIRLRRVDGSKLAVRGGKEGLFLPSDLPTQDLGRLLVTEGPTDAAALLDLGFSAVGRPSCTGGGKLLCDLLSRLRPTEAVVVADADAPGQRGAESLAITLLAYAPAVRVITPPDGIKDARAWRQAGGTAAEVRERIEAAPVRKLAMRTERQVR